MLNKIWLVIFVMWSWANAFGQAECGFIVVEENILTSNHANIIFVAGQDFLGKTTIYIKTLNSEGKTSEFNPVVLQSGVKQKELVKIWAGEFTYFSTTPWLYFDIVLESNDLKCFRRSMLPVNFPEQYKEPQIRSIRQVGFGNYPRFRIELIYDSTEPFSLLVNSSVKVNEKEIVESKPGEIEFLLDPSAIRKGKFLLTICQNSYCDTMIGRFY